MRAAVQMTLKMILSTKLPQQGETKPTTLSEIRISQIRFVFLQYII